MLREKQYGLGEYLKMLEKHKKHVIRCDNQSTIKLANNPIYHARTKHIETQHHFVREKLQSKEIDLSYCNTNENVADIFTKPLGKVKFEMCRNKLYIVENPNYVVILAET